MGAVAITLLGGAPAALLVARFPSATLAQDGADWITAFPRVTSFFIWNGRQKNERLAVGLFIGALVIVVVLVAVVAG